MTRAGTRSLKNKLSTFIRKLVEILENEPEEHICWEEDGRVVAIKNVFRFTDDILPRYFKHRNLPSFVRQLNLYDFNKIVSRHQADYRYQHVFFKRDELDLLLKIKRKVCLERESNHPEDTEKYFEKINFEKTVVARLKIENKQLRDKLKTISTEFEALKARHSEPSVKAPMMASSLIDSAQNQTYLNYWFSLNELMQAPLFHQTVNHEFAKEGSLQRLSAFEETDTGSTLEKGSAFKKIDSQCSFNIVGK